MSAWGWLRTGCWPNPPGETPSGSPHPSASQRTSSWLASTSSKTPSCHSRSRFVDGERGEAVTFFSKPVWGPTQYPEIYHLKMIRVVTKWSVTMGDVTLSAISRLFECLNPTGLQHYWALSNDFSFICLKQQFTLTESNWRNKFNIKSYILSLCQIFASKSLLSLDQTFVNIR